MRELRERFVSDEDSVYGRPKTFAHKWECFFKLRLYEQMGTLYEVRRWKALYEYIKDLREHDEFINGILKGLDK